MTKLSLILLSFAAGLSVVQAQALDKV